MISPASSPRMRGFTLLEVLVALAMVAVAAAGVMSLTGDLVRRMADARDRDALALLAQEIAYVHGRDLRPPVSKDGNCDTPHEECRWNISSESTSEPGRALVRIMVDCGDDRTITLERMLLTRGGN